MRTVIDITGDDTGCGFADVQLRMTYGQFDVFRQGLNDWWDAIPHAPRKTL